MSQRVLVQIAAFLLAVAYRNSRTELDVDPKILWTWGQWFLLHQNAHQSDLKKCTEKANGFTSILACLSFLFFKSATCRNRRTALRANTGLRHASNVLISHPLYTVYWSKSNKFPMNPRLEGDSASKGSDALPFPSSMESPILTKPFRNSKIPTTTLSWVFPHLLNLQRKHKRTEKKKCTQNPLHFGKYSRTLQFTLKTCTDKIYETERSKFMVASKP